MVEFIDDDDVEEVRFQLVDAEGRERLDRGEDVFPVPRFVLPDVEFPEGAGLHDVSEVRRACLRIS
jgi:hypothetical protein